MLKTMMLVMVVFAAMLNAQELLPELAVKAGKYKAVSAELDKQKREAIALAAKSYVSALDGVEKSATTKGEMALVAAVGKEREALTAGALEPDLPAGLPKMRLQGSRRALLGKLSQINTDFDRRKKQLDGNYLEALLSLQAKALTNPELAKQIATEKAALLNSVNASGSGAQTSKQANVKNAVVNGNFEKVVHGKPDGWTNTKTVTVEPESSNKFARFIQFLNKDGTSGDLFCDQTVEIPANAKTVAISVRIRTKDCVLREVGIPSCAISFLDRKGNLLSQVGQRWDGNNGSWQSGQKEGPIPKDAVVANVAISNGGCSGQIDFDDVEVTFK